MERKENDWLLVNMTGLGANELQAIGATPKNTSLLSKQEYLKSNLIKESAAFKDDKGNFSEDKFDAFYDAANILYNAWTETEFQGDVNEAFVDSLEWDSMFTARPLDAKVKEPVITFSQVYNPDRRSIGVAGVNKFGPRQQSRKEIASWEKIFDRSQNKFLDETVQDRVLIGGDPIKWAKQIFNPLVMAKWDEEGTHIDPITGFEINHNKGEYKLNVHGTYYTETLDGRNIYRQEVMGMFDQLTVDGSRINQIDFFDSDDLKKSIPTTIFHLAAKVAPLFINPTVAAVYGNVLVAREMSKILPALHKMIGGNTDSSSKTNKVLNNIAGIATSLSGTQSEYTQEKMITVETMANIISDVALQWAQQRAVANLTGRLMGSQRKYQAAIKRAEDTYDALPGATKGDLGKMIKGVKEWTSQGQLVLNNEVNLIQNVLRRNGTVGAKLALGYMALISNAEMYDEFIEAGASQAEAAAAAWAASAGMFAVDSYLGLDKLFLDNFEANVISGTRRSIRNSAKELRPIIANTAKNPKLTTIQKLNKSIKDAWRWGVDQQSQLFDNIKNGSASLLGRALGEGIEEVNEELVQDAVRGTFWFLNKQGWTSDEIKVEPFKDAAERYIMSFIGGLVGGGVFGAADLVNRGMSKYESDNLTEIIANHGTGELLRQLERERRKGRLGNPNLTTKKVNTKNGQEYFTVDGEISQNDAIYNAIKSIIEIRDNVINKRNLGLSDSDMLHSLANKNEILQRLLEENNPYTSLFTNKMKETRNRIVDLETELNNENSRFAQLSDTEKRNPENIKEHDEIVNQINQKLDAAQQEWDDFVKGRKSYEYTKHMMFALNDMINHPFVTATFEQYVRYFYGKNLDELNADETIKYKAEYEEYTIAQQAKDIITASNLFDNLQRKFAVHVKQLGLNAEEVASVEEKFKESLEEYLNKIKESDEEFDINNIKQLSELNKHKVYEKALEAALKPVYESMLVDGSNVINVKKENRKLNNQLAAIDKEIAALESFIPKDIDNAVPTFVEFQINLPGNLVYVESEIDPNTKKTIYKLPSIQNADLKTVAELLKELKTLNNWLKADDTKVNYILINDQSSKSGVRVILESISESDDTTIPDGITTTKFEEVALDSGNIKADWNEHQKLLNDRVTQKTLVDNNAEEVENAEKIYNESVEKFLKAVKDFNKSKFDDSEIDNELIESINKGEVTDDSAKGIRITKGFNGKIDLNAIREHFKVADGDVVSYAQILDYQRVKLDKSVNKKKDRRTSFSDVTNPLQNIYNYWHRKNIISVRDKQVFDFTQLVNNSVTENSKLDFIRERDKIKNLYFGYLGQLSGIIDSKVISGTLGSLGALHPDYQYIDDGSDTFIQELYNDVNDVWLQWLSDSSAISLQDFETQLNNLINVWQNDLKSENPVRTSLANERQKQEAEGITDPELTENHKKPFQIVLNALYNLTDDYTEEIKLFKTVQEVYNSTENVKLVNSSIYEFLNEMSSRFGISSPVFKVLNDIVERSNNVTLDDKGQPTTNEFILGTLEHRDLTNAIDLVNILESMIVAAATSPDAVFNHNNLLNQLNDRPEGLDDLVTISENDAQAILNQLESLKEKINYYLEISKLNRENKYKTSEVIGKQISIAKYNGLRQVLDPNIASEAIKAISQPVLMKIASVDPEKSTDKELYIAMYEAEEALYHAFNDYVKTSHNGNIWNALIELFPKLTENEAYDVNDRSHLDESLKTFTEIDKVILFLTYVGIPKSSLEKAYQETMQSDAFNNIAAIPSQKLLMEIITSYLLNPHTFHKVSEQVVQRLKESDTQVSDLATSDNALYLEAPGGVGKSSVIIKGGIDMYSKFKPNPKVMLSAPADSQVQILKDAMNNDSFFYLNKESLLRYILKGGYSALEQINLSPNRDTQLKDLIKKSDADEWTRVNGITFADNDHFDILIVDEITKYSNLERYLISEWAGKNNVSLIFSGNNYQLDNLPDEGFDLVQILSTPAIKTSMRENNAHVQRSLTSLNLFFGNLEQHILRNRIDTDKKYQGQLPVFLSENQSNIAQLHYYEDDNIFRGYKFIQDSKDSALDKIISTHSEIVYLYDDVTEKSDFHRIISDLKETNPNISMHHINNFQGDEADYVIINFSENEVYIDSDGPWVKTLKKAYTALTRNREGTLIVTESNTTFPKLFSIEKDNVYSPGFDNTEGIRRFNEKMKDIESSITLPKDYSLSSLSSKSTESYEEKKESETAEEMFKENKDLAEGEALSIESKTVENPLSEEKHSTIQLSRVVDDIIPNVKRKDEIKSGLIELRKKKISDVDQLTTEVTKLIDEKSPRLGDENRNNFIENAVKTLQLNTMYRINGEEMPKFNKVRVYTDYFRQGNKTEDFIGIEHMFLSDAGKALKNKQRTAIQESLYYRLKFLAADKLNITKKNLTIPKINSDYIRDGLHAKSINYKLIIDKSDVSDKVVIKDWRGDTPGMKIGEETYTYRLVAEMDMWYTDPNGKQQSLGQYTLTLGDLADADTWINGIENIQKNAEKKLSDKVYQQSIANANQYKAWLTELNKIIQSNKKRIEIDLNDNVIKSLGRVYWKVTDTRLDFNKFKAKHQNRLVISPNKFIYTGFKDSDITENYVQKSKIFVLVSDDLSIREDELEGIYLDKKHPKNHRVRRIFFDNVGVEPLYTIDSRIDRMVEIARIKSKATREGKESELSKILPQTVPTMNETSVVASVIGRLGYYRLNLVLFQNNINQYIASIADETAKQKAIDVLINGDRNVGETEYNQIVNEFNNSVNTSQSRTNLFRVKTWEDSKKELDKYYGIEPIANGELRHHSISPQVATLHLKLTTLALQDMLKVVEHIEGKDTQLWKLLNLYTNWTPSGDIYINPLTGKEIKHTGDLVTQVLSKNETKEITKLVYQDKARVVKDRKTMLEPLISNLFTTFSSYRSVTTRTGIGPIKIKNNKNEELVIESGTSLENVVWNPILNQFGKEGETLYQSWPYKPMMDKFIRANLKNKKGNEQVDFLNNESKKREVARWYQTILTGNPVGVGKYNYARFRESGEFVNTKGAIVEKDNEIIHDRRAPFVYGIFYYPVGVKKDNESFRDAMNLNENVTLVYFDNSDPLSYDANDLINTSVEGRPSLVEITNEQEVIQEVTSIVTHSFKYEVNNIKHEFHEDKNKVIEYKIETSRGSVSIYSKQELTSLINLLDSGDVIEIRNYLNTIPIITTTGHRLIMESDNSLTTEQQTIFEQVENKVIGKDNNAYYYYDRNHLFVNVFIEEEFDGEKIPVIYSLQINKIIKEQDKLRISSNEIQVKIEGEWESSNLDEISDENLKQGINIEC